MRRRPHVAAHRARRRGRLAVLAALDLARAAARPRHEPAFDDVLAAGRGDDGALVFETRRGRPAGRLHGFPGRSRPARAVGADRRRDLRPLRPSGRCLGGRAARRARLRRHRHGERQIARVHAARARGGVRAEVRPRALHLSDQGARAGSGARPAHVRARPAAGGLRRRHAARAAAPRAQVRESRSSRTPTCCTSESCRTTAAGPMCSRTSRTSWSTRRTPTAASSARTSRSSCGGCGASARSTAASRSSCSRARRSPTPPRPAPRSPGLDVRVVDADGAPRAPRRVAFWDTPLLDEAEGTRGSALGEAAGLLAALTARGLRTICFVKSRKASELVYRFARESLDVGRPRRRRRPPRALSRGLHGRGAPPHRGRPDLGAAARRGRDRGARARRRRRSARLRARGRLPGHGREPAPAVGPRRAPRRGPRAARARAPTRSTATSSTTPTPCSGAPNEAAILDPTNPEIRIGHLRAAACELPLVPGDDDVLGDGALAAAEPLVEAGELVRTPAGLAWRGAGSPAGHGLAALGLARRDRGRRAAERRAARHARAGARVRDRARGRGLPPPRRDLPRRHARSGRPRRARLAVRRAVVHAAAARDRDEHRAGAGRARAVLRRRARLRRRRGERPGGRLRAPEPARGAARSTRSRSTCRRASSRRARSGSCRRTS